MYWADLIAEKIIQRNPDKEEYVCAAGISPSGSIHIGNFRDIATSYMVVHALQKKGKKAKLLFSWDNFDRFRKVPVNVENHVGDSSYEKYIGMPYVDIPDPFEKESSYAEYFQKEFLHSFKEFGIEMDFRSQADEYRSGRYSKHIIHALKNRKLIFDLLDKHRTQEATEEERENYYPVAIYCPCCKKDTTTITSLSEDCITASYTCNCGYHGIINFSEDFNCKLPWKIDWPMRWLEEGVDFEPGGKDHASLHGSYDVAKDISKAIFGFKAPLFQGYAFIGIKGNVKVAKMSGSSGLNMTPEFLLKLYQPELILWLFSKNEPLKAFDFCLNDEILRHYFEFDKMLSAYKNGEADVNTQRIMENCIIDGREIYPVPMGQLVDLGSVVNFQPDMMESLFERIGTPYPRDQFEERLKIAKFWLKTCAPENEYIINKVRNWDYYERLDDSERKEISMLFEYLKTQEYGMDELKNYIYYIPKVVYPDAVNDMEHLKILQSNFFKHVYNLILSRDKGPRLYLYLYAVEKCKYLDLLDFSLNKDSDFAYHEYLEQIKKEEELLNKDEEPIAEKYVENKVPVKPLVKIEEFEKLDIRVCKILSCKPVRKTNKLYSLQVFDGISDREIVASIASDYTIEEMIGQNVIVLINLEPHKFGNNISHGMVLAAVNEDGCSNLLTVSKKAQIGSIIH